MTVDEQLSLAIIRAVAEHEGVEPMGLSVPLFEVIDTDALDRLFETTQSGRVRFQYLTYEVAVGSDGTVELRSQEDAD